MNLSVRPSHISNAGMGLFTEEKIDADTLIVEYTGEITTWDSVKSDWHNMYIYFITDEHVINARDYPEVYARYANDANGSTNVKALTNNCEFVNIDNRIFIRSLRVIMPGEEILVSYGDDYWKTVHTNTT